MITDTSAIILASGAGSRLGEITAGTPKPLLEFGGRPYLEILVDWLLAAGIDDIVITVHTHAGQIEDMVSRMSDGRVHTVREPQLVSTVQSARYGLEQARHGTCLILTADNLWDVDLEELVNVHRSQRTEATAMVTGAAGVANAGKVRVAADSNTVLQMWPGVRPQDSPATASRPASTMGLYVAEKTALLQAIRPDDTSIEREPMDRLVPAVVAYWNESFFFDFGTPGNLAYLQADPHLITRHLQHLRSPV